MRRCHDGDRADSYRRSLDDYDEYEEDGGEDQEEEEEDDREDPKPTEEELEYLKLRERIKDRIRQKYRKENADTLGRSEAHAQDRKGATTNAKFGSFFGPSQPVIAPRVIEESRSLRETQHIVAKVSSSYSGYKREPISTAAETKTRMHNGPPKVVNELKTKVQTLKDIRDYSFLLSDDAEFPAPAKEPASRTFSVPNSDARSAQAQLKTTMSTGKPSRLVPDGHQVKSSISAKQHMQTKVGFPKADLLSRPKSSSAGPRKLLGRNVGNGPGRPVKPKVPAQSEVTKKPHVTVVNKSCSSLEKTHLSKKPHALTQKHYPEKKGETQGAGKAKVIQKQPMSSSKPQLLKPSKKIPQRSMHEDHPRKRPLPKYPEEEDDDGEEAINMIRQMFRYNPSKYAGVDDDDSDMEVNFDGIMKEEQRSSRIARQEDEEQLRLIEEEERQERRRKEAKKHKLSQR